MEIFVKRAICEDSKDVASLFNDYRVFYGQDSNMTMAVNFISERLTNNESVIFYAQNAKGVFLGFTQLYPSFSSVWALKSWILNDLYVAPHARSLGVAKQLMNAAKDFAICTHAKGISLETTSDNLNAQALYESLGYQRSSDFYAYYLTV